MGFGSSWYTTYGAVQFIGVVASKAAVLCVCVWSMGQVGYIRLGFFPRGCIYLVLRLRLWIITCTAAG